MGRVVRVLADRVLIAPEPATAIAPLKPGDGVVFDAADRRSPEEPEEGGRIYHVRPARDGLLEVEFGNQAVNMRRVRAGDLLWRTDDPEVERAARPFTRPAAPLRRQPVAVRVTARAGAPLELEWRLLPPPARGLRADRTSEPTWLVPHWNAPAHGSGLPSPAKLERGRG